ncbi:MAG: lipopolysaccharide biosynthesis protein [Alistipes sp.]|nr:lipopolysaccharide biosynthesis protein [Alistipes sp.]
MSGRGLETKVASGIAWSFSEKLLTMAIQMVVSIIVARELMPSDFGIMAIMTFFTSVALSIVDSGFSQALIRKEAPTESDYRTVLFFNIITSVVLYIVLVALSYPVARIYSTSVITDIAPILFLILPINALCVVQTVMFTREFRFSLLSKIVFAASLISGAIAVVMAVMGCGIWSLVVQRLVMMGVKALAFWGIRRWRSNAAISLTALREMAPFSLRLLATDLIASIYNNVAQLFIGKMHNTSMLGYYSQAQKLKDLPVISTVQAVQGVTYPALAQIKDDREKFSQGYLRIVELLSFLLFPTMLCLVAVAADMFMLLLGDKWMPTVPYFEILALSGLFYPLGVVAYNVLKSCSNGAVIVRLEVAKRLIQTVILLMTIPRGVESVAWGITSMALVEFLMNSVVAMRYMSCGLLSLLRHIAPSITLAVAMFILLHFSMPLCASLHVALRLLLSVVIAVAFYLGGAWVFRVKALRELLSLVKALLSGSEH